MATRKIRSRLCRIKAADGRTTRTEDRLARAFARYCIAGDKTLGDVRTDGASLDPMTTVRILFVVSIVGSRADLHGSRRSGAHFNRALRESAPGREDYGSTILQVARLVVLGNRDGKVDSDQR